MKINIEKASKVDLEEIVELKYKVWTEMEHKEWYVINGTDVNFLSKVLDNKGLILKAIDEEKNKIIGFLIVERNLKPDCELIRNIDKNIDIKNCIEMSNAAILKEYRGNKIQQKLILNAEEIMLKMDKDIKCSYSTIHPDNIASLKSLLNIGYKVIAEKVMYKGKIRYILEKEFLNI